jgi:hypothetical protein
VAKISVLWIAPSGPPLLHADRLFTSKLIRDRDALWAPMKCAMGMAVQQFQIAWGVVGLVTVSMVHKLRRVQEATQHLFHYIAMLEHVPLARVGMIGFAEQHITPRSEITPCPTLHADGVVARTKSFVGEANPPGWITTTALAHGGRRALQSVPFSVAIMGHRQVVTPHEASDGVAGVHRLATTAFTQHGYRLAGVA